MYGGNMFLLSKRATYKKFENLHEEISLKDNLIIVFVNSELSSNYMYAYFWVENGVKYCNIYSTEEFEFFFETNKNEFLLNNNISGDKNRHVNFVDYVNNMSNEFDKKTIFMTGVFKVSNHNNHCVLDAYDQECQFTPA